MSEHAPTVLVGLGGLGSYIANQIYGQIPEESRKSVAIHAFDTDVNSIKKLEHIGKHVTQTSTRRSVGEYLHQYPSLSRWFPTHPELAKKTMTQGAGQVRAVSRLAFMSAIAEGKLNGLMENIESIFPVSSSQFEQGVRVIIISSLAGGTGSGIFLQVAMYLRKVLQERFGEKVLIRGAFMLPDVLTRTNTLSPAEWDSVRANGYACLKELDAITQSVQGEKKDGVTIELEYRPNQVDIQNRIEHAVTEKPYNFCFLYDYENIRGQHLHRVEDYIDQMSRSIYLQLFSPIADKHFSQEDNQIKQLIDSEGKGVYCGAGVSTLQYPYEEIIKYCALKWSVNGLDQSWLKLDELYEEERKQYELDLRNGIQREKLSRGKSYLSHLRQFGDPASKDPNPFFKEMFTQAHEVYDNNRIGKGKSIQFIEALDNHIDKTLKKDNELRMYETRCQIDDTKLSMKEHAKSTISKTESYLKMYADVIDKKIYEFRTMIIHQAIFQDYDAENKVKGNDFSLNTWLLKKENPIHPVSVRYVLYDISQRLSSSLKELREKNQSLKTKIANYSNAYDKAETEEFEDAVRRVDQTLDRGFFLNLLNNKFKDFINDYKAISSNQLQQLNQYKKSLLKEVVYQGVLESIQEMASDFERFFENLRDTRDSLLRDINQKALQFEETADPTKSYVLATKDLQEHLWSRVRDAEVDDIIPDEISEQIYINLYNQFYDKEKKSHAIGRQKLIKVETFYREHVVGYCEKKLKENPIVDIDFDVITALRKEAQILNKQEDQHVEERIFRSNNLALPFIPNMNEKRELKFWGVHSEAEKQLSEVDMKQLFEQDAIVDEAFSKYEVVCYRAHYGLEAHHFSKFSCGVKGERHNQLPGSYYEAYYKTVNKLNRNEPAVTPHLDKNWHLPAYMPDLNPNQQELDNKKINRALILGLIHNWIQVVNEQGTFVFLYNGTGSGRLILKGGKPIGNHFYKLHEALSYNPVIYDEILQLADKEVEKNLHNISNVAEQKFIQGASQLEDLKTDLIKNILDVVYHYEKEKPGDTAIANKARDLQKELFLEIKNYFRAIHGSHEGIARKEATKLIRKLWEESVVCQNTDSETTTYRQWENQIEAEIENLQVYL